MAQSWKIDFDYNLSCPVCLENFVGDHIPKDLDCPHVCCLQCLNELPSAIMGGLKCPICQTITSLPQGGVTSLRTNLVVRNLAETLHMHKKAEEEAGKNKSNMCRHHDNQEVLFFCQTCNVAICQYCIINDHAKHKYEPIQSLIKEQKQKLGRALQKVKGQIEKCEKYDVRVTEHQEMLSSKFQKAEAKIDEQIRACLDEVNQQGQELKDKLQKLKIGLLEGLQKQNESNQKSLQDKKQVLSDTQHTLDTASDLVYLVMHHKMFSNLKTLIEDDTLLSIRDYTNESGFKLEIGPWNVSLGMDLIPEMSGENDHNIPSTSSKSPESQKGQGDAGPFKKRFSRGGTQEPTSTKRCRIDEEEEEEVLYLSEDSSEEDDKNPDIFDLTKDQVD